MRRDKTATYVFSSFVVAGALFFIVGCIIGFRSFNHKNMTAAEAEIIYISVENDGFGKTSHTVYISFEANGETHVAKTGTYMSSYHLGKVIKIYYDNDNPNKIVVRDDSKIACFAGAFGLIFLAIGCFALVKENRAFKHHCENLKTVYATYTKTIRDELHSIDGHEPYVVLCEWTNPNDGEVYEFKSKALWFDPTDIIAERNIMFFPVQIEADNPSYYDVDISNLLDINK